MFNDMLKVCPFCGKMPDPAIGVRGFEGEYFLTAKIRCKICGVEINYSSKYFDDRGLPFEDVTAIMENVINRWNTRTEECKDE